MKLHARSGGWPLMQLDDRYAKWPYLLRRYQLGDEGGLELRTDFAAAWDACGRQLPAGARWTVIYAPQARPIAVGGLEPLGGRSFGAWGLASDLDARAWAFVRQAAAKVLDLAERELDARRFDAMAADTMGAIRLLARLGFTTQARHQAPDGATYLHMTRSF